jgi:hypothetical protein
MIFQIQLQMSESRMKSNSQAKEKAKPQVIAEQSTDTKSDSRQSSSPEVLNKHKKQESSLYSPQTDNNTTLEKKQGKSFKRLSIKATKGDNQASNLCADSYTVVVTNNISGYEIVSSLASHELRVDVHQGIYKKQYIGTGKIQTNILPVAQVGQKGELMAVDLTTGETLEVTWQWDRLNNHISFWQRLKNLFIA